MINTKQQEITSLHYFDCSELHKEQVCPSIEFALSNWLTCKEVCLVLKVRCITPHNNNNNNNK